jgi:hypothetical protein
LTLFAWMSAIAKESNSGDHAHCGLPRIDEFGVRFGTFGIKESDIEGHRPSLLR